MAKLPESGLHGGAGTRRATRLALGGGTVCLVLLLAPSLGAQQGAPPATPAATPETGAQQPAPPATSGWRIYRDPATGELLSTPLPGQAESLSAQWEKRRAALRPSEGLRTFPISLNGRTVGVGVRLDDRFVTSTVLLRNPDGSETLACVEGSEPPKPPPPAAAPER